MSSDNIELADFSRKTLAVEAINLMLSYGEMKVLNGAELKVPRGGIYALLGPSGCGKTTLIKCILGLLKPKSGDVTVFGERPGSKDSLVPGPGVGYMPQEDGLFYAFTVEETLMYFAKLGMMKQSIMQSKINEIVELLELPKTSQLAGELSGGQRKRLSLGAALVNEPALLVLDEPTVGVDVLLRRKIWKHLLAEGKMKQQTVILTTHYISEADGANLVAFMKLGKVICQASPQSLFQQLDFRTLEQAFLKLCRENCVIDYDVNSPIDSSNIERSKERKTSDFPNVLKAKSARIKAHIWKNYVSERNHPMLLFLKVALTVMQIVVYPALFGRLPTDLSIKVFNYDNDSISEEILSHVNKDVFDLKKVKVNDLINETNLVINEFAIGEHGAILFPQNYTLDILNLFINESEDNCPVWPQMHVFADSHNKVIVSGIEKEIYETTQRVRQSFEKQNESLLYFQTFERPFDVEFTGSGVEQTLSDTLTLNLLVLGIYFAALMIAAIQLQFEMKDSFFSRNLVSGLTFDEMLLSFVICSLPIVVIQAIWLQMFASFLYSVRITTSYAVQIFVLQLLSGIAGTLNGHLIAAVVNSELLCAVVLFACYIDMTILTGGMISVSALPKIFYYFSKLIPVSQTMLTVKYLLIRQWNVTNIFVIMGYVIPIIGSVTFFALTIFVLKRKFN